MGWRRISITRRSPASVLRRPGFPLLSIPRACWLTLGSAMRVFGLSALSGPAGTIPDIMSILLAGIPGARANRWTNRSIWPGRRPGRSICPLRQDGAGRIALTHLLRLAGRMPYRLILPVGFCGAVRRRLMLTFLAPGGGHRRLITCPRCPGRGPGLPILPWAFFGGAVCRLIETCCCPGTDRRRRIGRWFHRGAGHDGLILSPALNTPAASAILDRLTRRCGSVCHGWRVGGLS